MVGILEGVQAAQENWPEADLVARLAVALRERLRPEKGGPPSDDSRFWREERFIVSPHHAQIHAFQTLRKLGIVFVENRLSLRWRQVSQVVYP